MNYDEYDDEYGEAGDSLINELDRPYGMADLAMQATERLGVPVSTWTLHRLARSGHLPVTERALGKRRSTLRAVLSLLTPTGEK